MNIEVITTPARISAIAGIALKRCRNGFGIPESREEYNRESEDMPFVATVEV